MEKVLIIGAGPAGLAMAGRFRKNKIPFDIIEQAHEIAHRWEGHYDRLCLHTVNDKSSLPHLNFPKGFPVFVSKFDLLSYFDTYAKTFNIKPKFNQTVQQITRNSNGFWEVKTQNQTYAYQQIVIATGVNSVPFLPKWKGMDSFSGTILHSRFYKNPQPFIGKKVLVVGMGNTGAEVALDLSESGVETYISIRGPINIVPRSTLGRPIQDAAILLKKLPNWLGDSISNFMQKMTIGNLEKFGIEKPNIAPVAQLRETGKTPVIDLGTAAAIRAGKIKVLKDVAYFGGNTVSFTNEVSFPFDAVILCTGYRSKLELFIPSIVPFLDENKNPKSPIGVDKLEGLYFLGFDIFKPGGILGVIRNDSLTILNEIRGH